MTEPSAEVDGRRTCYRHPDRETAVSCTRCERPICPDCMRPAAVGFQCPECVKEGNRSIREKRTLFGGRVGGGDGVMTKILIGLCVAAFLRQRADDTFTLEYAMLGYRGRDGFAIPDVGVAGGEYFRMITSAFLHADFIHIAFNMYALYAFGPTLEQALGTARFLAVYVLSALGGSVAVYLITPSSLAVGASGAIFGLFGAYFVVARRVRADTSQIVGLIAINLLLGAVIKDISNEAHIGGLLVGAGVTYVLAHTARLAQRDIVQGVAVAAVAVVLVVLTMVKTQAVREEYPALRPAALSLLTDA